VNTHIGGTDGRLARVRWREKKKGMRLRSWLRFSLPKRGKLLMNSSFRVVSMNGNWCSNFLIDLTYTLYAPLDTAKVWFETDVPTRILNLTPHILLV